MGDRVFGLSEGGSAGEYAALTAWAPFPDTWTVERAAAVAAETSTRMLNVLGVREGSTLLIDGAAGGSAAPPSRSR